MKTNIFIILIALFTNASQVGAQDNFNHEDFAKTYFDAWNKTQMPNASEVDLDDYLVLLTDDVAYQHLPYRSADERKQNGKEILRKGMNQWLGANTSYRAKLIEVNHGHNVVIIKYQAIMTVKNEETRKERTIERNNIEVLEIDKGKVSVIRKYGKY
jgi:ketosteroid isomerase-like protein